MSNILFKSEDTDKLLSVYHYSGDNTIVIYVEVKDSVTVLISLDIPTAIQFSKQLRKEIANAKEVNNG